LHPMPVLAIRVPEDGVLGAVAPLGLAVAAPGPAVVIDLDPEGPAYPGEGSLRSLIDEGPRRADLTPSRRGFAVLRNGDVSLEEAAPVIEAMIGGWPNTVLRLPPRGIDRSFPTVTLRLLVPGGLFGVDSSPVAYQSAGWRLPPPGPGPLLPRPAPRTLGHLMTGVLAVPDRWLRGLGKLWDMPWG